MTAVGTPRPRPHPFWSDTRFLLGVLLVATSIGGVWLVVATARQTSPFLVAARTIVPGEAIGAGDLREVEVSLGTAASGYTGLGEWEDGAVATRTIAEGELVPRDAVGAATASTVTSVVVATAGVVPATVAVGSRVEVWHAPPADDGYETPRILVADAVVAALPATSGVVSTTGAALELVIPRASVADVLAAQSDGSVLSVVPAG